MTLRGGRQADFAYQAVYRYMVNLINEVSTDTRVKLPSLRQLSLRLNVSISTIQYAYSLLEKEGKVYSVAKSGYYAWPLACSPSGHTDGDLLERVYREARRPGMVVLSGDEPALLASLDETLLRLERELVRQYPLQPWSQPCGVWELRAAVAARYTSSPIRCWHADDVFIGADLCGVLDILIQTLGLRGTTVIVESPCDWLILRLLQDAGVRIIEWPWAKDGSADLAALESILRDEPVQLALLSSTVSQPAGRALTPLERMEVAHLLDQHACWLLENDTWGELSFKPAGTALRDLVNPERVMVFSSFEKVLGPEAPYGYVLCRHLGIPLQRQFLLRSFRLSVIRQRAIARLYHSGRIDRHVRSLRVLLCEQAMQMHQQLEQHLGGQVSCDMPAGGATFWLKSAHHVDMRQVFQQLLVRQVSIAPGELFSVGGLYHQHVRVSLPRQGQPDLEIALMALSEALQQAQTA